jgi:hypothetical protein
MEIHKPKPIHNWREFLKEVGIIVLGVSIALGAEQAVEYFHWKNRIRDAAEAMRIELGVDDGPQAFTRLAIAACLDRQLDGLQGADLTGSFCTKRNVRTRFGKEFLSCRRRDLARSRS